MFILWKSIYLLQSILLAVRSAEGGIVVRCGCNMPTLCVLLHGARRTWYCHLTGAFWYGKIDGGQRKCAKSTKNNEKKKICRSATHTHHRVINRRAQAREAAATTTSEIDEKGRMPFGVSFYHSFAVAVVDGVSLVRFSVSISLFAVHARLSLICYLFYLFFLLSIKWQLKLLNYTFIEIYEFVNQNLWLGARQDPFRIGHAANRTCEKNVEKKTTIDEEEKCEYEQRTKGGTHTPNDSSCFAFEMRIEVKKRERVNENVVRLSSVSSRRISASGHHLRSICDGLCRCCCLTRELFDLITCVFNWLLRQLFYGREQQFCFFFQ